MCASASTAAAASAASVVAWVGLALAYACQRGLRLRGWLAGGREREGRKDEGIQGGRGRGKGEKERKAYLCHRPVHHDDDLVLTFHIGLLCFALRLISSVARVRIRCCCCGVE